MRSRVQHVRGLVIQNGGWKLLSLAVAFLIWAFVVSEPELATTASVRVMYKNLPDGLEIASDPVSTVSLELRGPSGILRRLGETGAQPEVVLDMANVRPGQRTFAIGDGNVNLPRGTSLVRSVPSEARFTFEQRRRLFVTVMPRFAGQGQNGYAIDEWSVEPHDLEIVGPESHVLRVGTLMTDPIDVSSVVGTSEFRVNAYLEDPYVRFWSSPQVTVKVTMQKR